jgi:dGTPase
MAITSWPDDERFVAEPRKDSATGRGPYQRDRARVLHSAAFRRLAAKTQVHTAGSDAFLRTRLTHSLEVAQIAREIGGTLGCDPDVVDTAALAHDLGHPPFGHNGEDALDELAQECGGFEGNAQTLRVLSRLEAKVVAPDGEPAGLNLTRASLDAVLKYPWPRRPGQRKFGAYEDDLEIFQWVRRPAPESDRRCLEAQVMDWSDDVAYSVHDVEDGFHGGYVPLRALVSDPSERGALCADVAEVYSSEPVGEFGEVLDSLLQSFVPLLDYDGGHRAQAALKATTSALTGRFAASATEATRAKFGDEPLSRYAADLIVPRLIRMECALLKGIALRYVMRRAGSGLRYAQQRELLHSLVARLADRAPESLDVVFAPLWRAAANDRERMRVVLDQVASLTDPAAVHWHRRFVD